MHDEAFERMKVAYVNCVQLYHYIPGKRYKLQADASDVGVSGILCQTGDEGFDRIVSLVSRCFNEAESHISTTEKELL